jgi:uncharacterized membrane protein
MLYPTLKTLHLLAIIVWIGGMVFSHFFLRPAAAALQPPDRVRLMHAVLGRFFAVVLGLSVLVLVSGLWMIGAMAKQAAQSGGHFSMPLEWTVMATLGIVMFLIFGHIRFVLYKRLAQAVQTSDWLAGAAALASLRGWVAANLGIGVLVVLITLMGLPR